MKNWHSQYPDISDLLAQKASGRRQRGALSFAEKLVILDSLKARVEPIVQARKIRSNHDMTANSANDCPVCGYDGLASPPYDKRGFGSLEICPSCGFQFNVSDTKHGWSHLDWRKRWVANGMPWSSATTERPKRWNPKNQIGRLSLPKSN